MKKYFLILLIFLSIASCNDSRGSDSASSNYTDKKNKIRENLEFILTDLAFLFSISQINNLKHMEQVPRYVGSSINRPENLSIHRVLLQEVLDSLDHVDLSKDTDREDLAKKIEKIQSNQNQITKNLLDINQSGNRNSRISDSFAKKLGNLALLANYISKNIYSIIDSKVVETILIIIKDFKEGLTKKYPPTSGDMQEELMLSYIKYKIKEETNKIDLESSSSISRVDFEGFLSTYNIGMDEKMAEILICFYNPPTFKTHRDTFFDQFFPYLRKGDIKDLSFRQKYRMAQEEFEKHSVTHIEIIDKAIGLLHYIKNCEERESLFFSEKTKNEIKEACNDFASKYSYVEILKSKMGIFDKKLADIRSLL